jgi:hypothetical protein
VFQSAFTFHAFISRFRTFGRRKGSKVRKEVGAQRRKQEAKVKSRTQRIFASEVLEVKKVKLLCLLKLLAWAPTTK